MLITCDNKGCLAQSNALVRLDTKEVICSECGKPIRNVSETMKRVLISSGHVIREEKKAFTMGCRNCNANRQVVVDSDNNTVCKVCLEEINVHPAMRQAILEAGERIKTQTETKPNKGIVKRVEAAPAAVVEETEDTTKTTKRKTKKTTKRKTKPKKKEASE